ncbi:MAG: hypothetical protein WD423_12065 [Rhodothermales bacterium]
MAMNRDEFVEKLKQQIDEWNEKIDRLEQRVREGRAEAEGTTDERLVDLRRRRDDLRARLRELQSASEEAWSDLKTGIERARKELGDAFARARSHYED